MSTELIFFGLCLLVLVIVRGIPALIKRFRGPTTAYATIVSRRMELSKMGGHWSDNWNRLITFQLKDGSEVELYVSKEEYATLEDGQSGQITWEDDTLSYFDPD